ncbi:MAG: hypothetical protein JJU29_16270 [Verrucomicrobia bacterium]|nr:hypothetical protein [Verrucomicrobiota bacterium]
MNNFHFKLWFSGLLALVSISAHMTAGELQKASVVSASDLGEPYSGSGYAESPAGVMLVEETSSESPMGTTFYDHGELTIWEQLMLEMVNRARADPGAEAARLGIGLNHNLPPGTIEDTPKPPLAIHPRIVDAARGHSQWMLDTDTFTHAGAGGSTPKQRMEAEGYQFTGFWRSGENIAWSGNTGAINIQEETISNHDGLFISAGHRENLMQADFDELGIGILEGQFTDDGITYNVAMATQKFATSGNTPSPFLLGIAYYDFDGDDFYSPGEAIGGLEVTIADGAYHTFTAPSGGYALPMPASAGTRQVTFSDGLHSESFSVAFPGGENVKVDLVMPYAPPVISGSATPAVGLSNVYEFTPVLGATAYEVQLQSREPFPTDNPSPSGLSENMIVAVSGYTPLSDGVKHSGTHAYHLVHPVPETQRLTYSHAFVVSDDASMSFQSRLGWASQTQIARVLISVNDGNSWTEIYAQAGSGTGGETGFTPREIDLDAYAGEEVRLAFSYEVQGSYFPQTSNGVGWYIDQVEFTNLLKIESLDTVSLDPGESFVYTPDEENSLWIQVQPFNHGTAWPPGPAMELTGVPPTPYQTWAADVETSQSLPPGTLSQAPFGDYSQDGTANLMAFVLGLDPTASLDGSDLPRFEKHDGEFVFAYAHDTGAANVVLTPQISVDLENWYDWDDPLAPVNGLRTHVGTSGSQDKYHLSFDVDSGVALSVRLVVGFAP